MDLFEQGRAADYLESEVVELLGVTVQTLRNWRRGYKDRSPRLTKGKDWYKATEQRTAPVYYSGKWVEGMIKLNQLKQELL
jgi:hypothetical protein